MLKNFENHINLNFPFLIKGKALIAISGGLDSVVLVHLCHKFQLNFALAHCNFNLRGEESDADEDFVLQLAEDLEVEVFIESFDTKAFANKHQISIQMAARELRYNWFQDLAEQLHFDHILTAHHADDNLETFLINLSRGSGLEGLTGIPEVNDYILRPLLPFSRQDIETYAKENKLTWREDSSNASTKYLRNKLRHKVIPILKEINPQLLQNFNKTLSFLKDSNEIVEDRITNVQKKVVSIEGDLVKLDIKKLLKLSNPKAYLYQLLKDFKFTEWDDVTDLLRAQSGKQVFSETHRLLKDRESLILSESVSNDILAIHISEQENQIKTPLGTLNFKTVKHISKSNASTIYVDAETLKFPLTFRTWQEGDYFYPFGMKGKKKLSKYFKDEKLSLIDKEHIWLLCSENEIVWIVGKRADDRFKIVEDTKRILKIELE
ncbi:tRNA lysidine(34) synthetase TilS [Flavobacteriaceae bacterium LMO-SS05]